MAVLWRKMSQIWWFNGLDALTCLRQAKRGACAIEGSENRKSKAGRLGLCKLSGKKVLFPRFCSFIPLTQQDPTRATRKKSRKTIRAKGVSFLQEWD